MIKQTWKADYLYIEYILFIIHLFLSIYGRKSFTFNLKLNCLNSNLAMILSEILFLLFKLENSRIFIFIQALRKIKKTITKAGTFLKIVKQSIYKLYNSKLKNKWVIRWIYFFSWEIFRFKFTGPYFFQCFSSPKQACVVCFCLSLNLAFVYFSNKK